MEDMMHEAAEKRLDHIVCVNETCGEKFIKTDLLNPEDAFKPKWLDADGKVLPSTKTLAIKAQILNWFDIDSKSKVIVFTQVHIHLLSFLVEPC